MYPLKQKIKQPRYQFSSNLKVTITKVDNGKIVKQELPYKGVMTVADIDNLRLKNDR